MAIDKSSIEKKSKMRKTPEEKFQAMKPYLGTLGMYGLELAFAAERALDENQKIDRDSLDILWRVYEDIRQIRETPRWVHHGSVIMLEGVKCKDDNFLPILHEGLALIYDIVDKIFKTQVAKREYLKPWQRLEIQTLIKKGRKEVGPETLEKLVLSPSDWKKSKTNKPGTIWAAYRSAGIIYEMNADTIKKCKDRRQGKNHKEYPLTENQFSNIFRNILSIQQSAISWSANKEYSDAGPEAVNDTYRKNMSKCMDALASHLEVGFYGSSDGFKGSGKQITENMYGLDRLRNILDGRVVFDIEKVVANSAASK